MITKSITAGVTGTVSTASFIIASTITFESILWYISIIIGILMGICTLISWIKALHLKSKGKVKLIKDLIKEAKADGKISKEELKEIIHEIGDAGEEIIEDIGDGAEKVKDAFESVSDTIKKGEK